jgi:2-hydroxychromene-2-carboxylate isomerase
MTIPNSLFGCDHENSRKSAAMRQATWYFDYLSPFAYLQFHRFKELPQDLEVMIKPVVFGALLQHHGQLGPAEIPSKRRFVYRFFKWQCDQRGLPLLLPSHPFAPLPLLRLTIAAGSTPEVVKAIFQGIYGEGRAPGDAETIRVLGTRLGINDPEQAIQAEAVKEQLRDYTNEAIAAGAFGVPTFVTNQELFWGDDALPMLLSYLDDPGLFEAPEMKRISNMPMGIVRRRPVS